jgi:ubiquinone biosynthesis monooxygenase Coq7
VEGHLAGHIARLPAQDRKSSEVLEQMKADEMRHAEAAIRYGARELPAPVRVAMKLSSKVMTRLSYVA